MARARLGRSVPESPRHFCEQLGDGGENSSLDDFVRNAEENSKKELAERVGVFAHDLPKPNECNGFAIISRNRNDLTFCVRLPILKIE